MKRQVFSIFWLLLWALFFGSTFAQWVEYTSCTKDTTWIFVCKEYESCNNPGWSCSCLENSLFIPHNTTCLENNTFIKERVISSFAVSWSTVVLKFTVKNTTNTPKRFEIKLPPAYKETRIQIKEMSSSGLLNGAAIILNNYFWNPLYTIDDLETKTIIITGEISTSNLIFPAIETSACFRNTFSPLCIEQPVSFIFPTSNFAITQRALPPFALFSWEQALYEVQVTNNWSKQYTNEVYLAQALSRFLGTATLNFQNTTVPSSLSDWINYSWNLGTLAVGETKTYLLTAPLLSTPAANTTITTTGHIVPNNEILLSDNTAVASYTVPTVVDIFLDTIEKSFEEPEIQGNTIWYTIFYSNKGNTPAQGITLHANISWTNQTATTFTLPDLDPDTKKSFVVTGNVAQNFPIGTSLCFSWTITATNETATGNNNSLSGFCYTFVQSADIEVQANLVNESVSITKGTILTYTITLSNKGGKTANPITLSLTPSNNQTPQSPTIFTGISLAAGETKIISYTSILSNYPINWTTLSLSWIASFPGIDSNTTNNSFELTTTLPWLADVYVSHSMLPFSWFSLGDTVTYVVSYGNSWFAAAWNPTITFAWSSFLQFPQTTWNLWKSLAPGATGTLIVTGTLQQFLAAGMPLLSQSTIATTSAQTTTGNDSFSITGNVWSYNNVSFSLLAQNQTRTQWNISQQVIRAVSGHVISFTLTYVNNWNVPAENTTLTFSNLGSLSLPSSTYNLGTIWVKQQWSLVITWYIRNFFSSFTTTATLSYNTTGISYSWNFQEPNQCGDWFLSSNEVCEEQNQLGVTNPDQVCENQQGICTLVTKRITNKACVEINWVISSCDEAVLPLAQPSCATIQTEYIDDTSLQVRCFGKYDTNYTLFRISCGNGQSITWYSFNQWPFSARCSYGSSAELNASAITCNVGNNAQACTTSALSCDLDVESPVVILDPDQNNWSVDVECSTRNGKQALLEIDCGNGKTASKESDHMRYTCTYKKEDFSRNRDISRNISCRVNGSVACEDEVILDQGIMGVCWNGIREGYEQCDLLPNGSSIGNDLDERNNNDASSAVRGKACYNCAIEDEAPAQCLSVHNANISIEKWEYLPFWWNVNTDSFASSSTCPDKDEGKIIKSSMKCTFELQKPWKAKQQETKKILETDCIQNPWSEYKIFNYFKQYISSNTWKYAVNPSIFNARVDDDLGEYKLKLSRVEYDYCWDDWEKERATTDNVCETNFTITKPYLVQKSAFGMTPKTTTIDLRDFYTINKEAIISRTDLADVMVLDESSYEWIWVTSPMIDSFVKSAERLAVSTKAPGNLASKVTAKKVPNKEIYILYGNNNDLNIINWANISKPFTLIVKNANLVIDGNIDVNGMFIVQNGTIKFNDTSCKGQQIVKGIFVANKFSAVKNTNDSLYKERCNAGGLYVKWVLIGWGIENLVQNKRSNLSRWFRVSWSESSIETQRRNMIFNGASVLIEYSPELWQQLPPGADEFTKALEVYKK